MYNPYFGMYTFMPFYGTAFSPFGYAYYTPITVVPVYASAPVQGGPVRGILFHTIGSRRLVVHATWNW